MKFKGEEVTFLGWLDNVWYHFKAHIVISFFALVIVVVGMTQMITKEEHDVFIYCVGQIGLSAEAVDNFTNEMQDKFTDDFNGDGKRIVDLKFDKFIMAENAAGNKVVYNPSEQLSVSERFNLELAAGECIVYIMEPAFFYGNVDYLEPLDKALGFVPANAIEGKGIKMSDLKSYKATMTLSYFPEDYIICLADKDDRYSEQYYGGNVEFLSNVIKYNLVS